MIHKTTETNRMPQTKKVRSSNVRTYHMLNESQQKEKARRQPSIRTYMVSPRKRQDKTNDVQNRNRKKGRKRRKIKQINSKNARKTTRKGNTHTSGSQAARGAVEHRDETTEQRNSPPLEFVRGTKGGTNTVKHFKNSRGGRLWTPPARRVWR